MPETCREEKQINILNRIVQLLDLFTRLYRDAGQQNIIPIDLYDCRSQSTIVVGLLSDSTL